MAKGKCCGEPQLPKTLSNTTLIDPRIINPEFINATFTHDCSGRPVTEETPVVSCEDLANGAAVSDDKGNIITPGQDGGAYLGISDAANNVTKLDGKGKLYTPISNQIGNLTKKGTDGGIFTGISGDSGNIASRGSDGGVMVAATKVVTAIKGCDGRNHTSGTTIPSCAQMNAAVSSATSEAAVVSKLKGCDGRNHTSGTTIPSCAQMNAAIAAAIRGLNLANLISKDAGNGLTLGSDGKLFLAKSSSDGSGGSGGMLSGEVTVEAHLDPHTSTEYTTMVNVRGLKPNTVYATKVHDGKNIAPFPTEFVGYFTSNANGEIKSGRSGTGWTSKIPTTPRPEYNSSFQRVGRFEDVKTGEVFHAAVYHITTGSDEGTGA